MAELLRDPEVMTSIIRRRVLRAMVPAVKKLDRVARGLELFRDEHQLRACVALGRLAPMFISAKQVPDDRWPRPHPSHSPERAQQLTAKLHALQCQSREAGKEVAHDNGWELEDDRGLHLVGNVKEES